MSPSHSTSPRLSSDLPLLPLFADFMAETHASSPVGLERGRRVLCTTSVTGSEWFFAGVEDMKERSSRRGAHLIKHKFVRQRSRVDLLEWERFKTLAEQYEERAVD